MTLLIVIVFPYPFQPLAIYLNWVSFPFFVDWRKGGERFGFRAKTVKPFFIRTNDGLELGAWHVIPRNSVGIRSSINPNIQSSNQSDNIDINNNEIKNNHGINNNYEINNNNDNQFDLNEAELVFIYFHGNAGNRATFHRTNFYKVPEYV